MYFPEGCCGSQRAVLLLDNDSVTYLHVTQVRRAGRDITEVVDGKLDVGSASNWKKHEPSACSLLQEDYLPARR